MTKQIKTFFIPFAKLLIITLIVGIAVRIVLLFNEQTLSTFTFADYVKIFAFGFINDFCIAFMGTLCIYINAIFISDVKYRKPLGYIILGLLVAVLCYMFFFDKIITEFNKGLAKVLTIFALYKCVSFALRMFIPKIRKTYSIVIISITIFIYLLCVTFNAIGEYFFWSEFGVRYNFIAVDYLIYTNEVVGNIMESYPVIPLFSAIALIALVLTYVVIRYNKEFYLPHLTLKNKFIATAAYVLLFVVSIFTVQFMQKAQNSQNVYVNELQANGVFKFYNAFTNSELDYDKFYMTLPKEKVVEIINDEYDSKGFDNKQIVIDSLPETHKNIILITVESLSAKYLAHFGNAENLTPNIDSLYSKGIALYNLYANGNRTVRGLEAITLSIPPSPGESLIKRQLNTHLFSISNVLKSKGYSMQFLYGGDSYFDNMESFFEGNGFEVIDQKDMTADEETFRTIWGVCDEDIFAKAIKVADANNASQHPFYMHIMTVSNHRPYLYPEGKIDISPTTKSRRGGIKYTDFAIGKFMAAAAKQPWFKNTVFVITADHCASSAGKTEVPLDKYHIPAVIYAPEFATPQNVDILASQIDIMPTLFGLLHFSYTSKFYGENIFDPNYRPRAVVATYQNLGFLKDSIFTVLSPVRRVQQYKIEPAPNHNYKQTPINYVDSTYLNMAIANYQSIEYLSNVD